MDIVVAYCERWDTPLRTSKHHYIERLADAGHRVLYVEVPPNPLAIARRPGEFFAKTLPRLRAGVEQVRPNVWAMTGLFPLPFHRGLGGIFDRKWLNTLNQRFFLPRLRGAMDRLGFSQPVLLSYYPFLVPVLGHVGFARVVFHMVDEWEGLGGIPHAMAELTREMLGRADVTIVPSQRLFARYQPFSRDIRLLRHGTDCALFEPVSQGKVAPDPRLQDFSGPKIGYYGALHKLDFDLVREAALRQPEWAFIFIGPAGRGSQGGGPGETLPPNVHFWPSQDRATLPAFLAGIGVFWMPFEINELTHSMCPIKIYEVLSAGLPMVISKLDESRTVAGDLGIYAVDVTDHLRGLEQALANDEPMARTQRAAAVRGCDWNTRFQEFAALLAV